jgi:plasmid stabilization system protein ParE
MTARYVLTQDAAQDLVDIWRYIKDQNSVRVADEVELEIRRVMGFLAGSPNAGHVRKDLTEKEVRFFPVHSYLIIYRAETRPLQVASIIHGGRDVAQSLRGRI